MILYARRIEGITAKKWALFQAMERDVDAFPDLEPAEAVSCHVLCHALSVRHNLPMVSGWYGGKMNWHSWIDLGDGIIADMYPIAGGRSQIVDSNGILNPVARLYVEVDDALERISIDPKPLSDILLAYLN